MIVHELDQVYVKLVVNRLSQNLDFGVESDQRTLLSVGGLGLVVLLVNDLDLLLKGWVQQSTELHQGTHLDYDLRPDERVVKFDCRSDSSHVPEPDLLVEFDHEDFAHHVSRVIHAVLASVEEKNDFTPPLTNPTLVLGEHLPA